MKRRISTTEIDRFFDQLKEQSPIYTEEKVHQIINSPEAKARLKGKQRNLLKFTVMTTIFAVIVSAVLFWTGSDLKNFKFQDSGYGHDTNNEKVISFDEQADMDIPDGFEKSNIDAEKQNKSDENKHIATADLNHKTSDIEPGNALVEKNEPIAANNQEIKKEPAQQIKKKAIDFDPETIQPIDGSRFILNLTNEELKKIGFEITDSSIIYEYVAFENLYKYGIVRKRSYNSESGNPLNLVDENGEKYTNSYYPLLSRNKNFHIPESQRHDFYAIYTTTTLISNIQPLNLEDYITSTTFEMRNDTLLPILVPSLEEDGGQSIFWFIFTDHLYNILAQNHKSILDEFRKFKIAKNFYPKKDLVIYQTPFKIDKTKTIKLSRIDLNKLGFKFFWDSVAYSGAYTNYSHSINFSFSGQISSQATDKNIEVIHNEDILAIFATTNDGDLLGNGLLSYFMKNQLELGNDFSLLIPVWVQLFDNLPRDAIFWFLPTEGFFNALPDSIGNDLRKEYNYITAEDKSALVQPGCKYFDECKNTLDVSKFKVFPNPANNTATVSFTLNEAINGRITLVDLAGREKQVLQPNTNYSKGSHQIDVDVSSVPGGIYLLTLYSDKGIQTQRIIVNKQ